MAMREQIASILAQLPRCKCDCGCRYGCFNDISKSQERCFSCRKELHYGSTIQTKETDPA